MEAELSDLHSVVKSYEKYDEDSRLSADNIRRLEFLTALVYMNKYLKKDMAILDVAAGTGAYALYFAALGMKVTALDLTPSYIEILKKKAADQNLSIRSFVNDARDLSIFEDASFDCVFCMGPIYHLPKEADREKVMRESLRVLKPGGLFYLAYINKYFIFSHLASQNKQFLQEKWYQRIIEQGEMSAADEDCFWTDTWFTTPGAIERLAGKYQLEMINHIAQDGVGRLLADEVNSMRVDEFKRWAEYHIRTCEEPSILGISNHGLYIGRKLEN